MDNHPKMSFRACREISPVGYPDTAIANPTSNGDCIKMRLVSAYRRIFRLSYGIGVSTLLSEPSGRWDFGSALNGKTALSVMRNSRSFLLSALLVTLLLASLAGCARQSPQQPDLSDARVRELATKYRNEWLATNASTDAGALARGTIQSVERLAGGWHVVFVTATGHSSTTPEGVHDYFVHIYLKLSGQLDRIERGPDKLT